jgi:hypothetical protein
MRTFSFGDPGLPKNGLLIGSGGGFTHRYTDFALHTDGLVERLEYGTEGGPIPPDYVTTGRGNGMTAEIAEFLDKLSANEFWSTEIKLPDSDMFEYIVAVNEKKGAHSIICAYEGSDCPDAIWSIRNGIHEYALKIVGN